MNSFDCLYHYCSNEKCFAILNSKTIRLSDIQKSNDYKELSLLFPEIIFEIENLYKKNPFPFKYDNKDGLDAFLQMTRESYSYWSKRLTNGEFSNFIVCFSECCDSLSQWRGYADNGKGCCIGFTKRILQEYCARYKDVLRFEKVIYLSKKQNYELIRSAAEICVEKMKGIRKWTIEQFTHDDEDPETDKMVRFYLDYMMENMFIDSLKYKSCAFQEEAEWRIFFRKHIYKIPHWVCRDDGYVFPSPEGVGFSETISYLNNKIKFQVTDNDIIPFCPINFEEFTDNPIAEIWTGPKNKILEKDIKLYLEQNGYNSTQAYHSSITYC